ncbi:class I SAM-dependent methyltransferase [Clostridium sp. KNHs214]|uniref:tRNA (mnm(5)s(2)U34)-methyltransferase n=1 Tax=Clostridium sp. KNHs214 TaxID=1540257 RepID=UPI0005565A34|nr:class I SAM-dependent methyltransferase [Clostridium sp. KNHs214]
MFKYGNNISQLAQDIIKNYCSNFNVAVDATLGNGHDTDFLSSIFHKVYSFDIQDCVVENYKNRGLNNVMTIKSSHEYIHKYVKENVDCVMYNLGYLPGGDKSITTKASSTLDSIISSLKLLNCGGIITLCIYWGHQEGKEEKESILNFVEKLSKKEFSVIMHSYLNRSNDPPILLVIEKK